MGNNRLPGNCTLCANTRSPRYSTNYYLETILYAIISISDFFISLLLCIIHVLIKYLHSFLFYWDVNSASGSMKVIEVLESRNQLLIFILSYYPTKWPRILL